MEKDRIIVIGAGIVDVLLCPVNAEVFKKGSVPVEHIRMSTGGDALNEATVLARLGKKVSLVTVIGEDEAGKNILSHCEREGMETRLICQQKDLETGVNIVMVQEDGSRSFFTNPASSLRRLSLEHIPEVFPEDTKIICLASIFVSPMLGDEEMAEIFRRAKAQNLCICADMTKCKHGETVYDIRKTLAGIDYLFANEEEAKMAAGTCREDYPSRESFLVETAQRFLECGVKNMIIKLQDQGCYVKNKEISRHFSSVPCATLKDTTGAGDSFGAGFLAALCEEKSLEECILWANTCGSLAVEAIGATQGIKSREQVEKRIRSFAEIFQK